MEPAKRTAIEHLSDNHQEKEEEEILDEEPFSLPRHGQPIGYADYDAMEQANVHLHIPETNMGYRLLQKLGWKAGQGLGSHGQGRVDPIPIDIKEDALGVGKAEEEAAYHASSTAKRKTLDSERQLEETTEERALRETKAKEQEMIKEELREVKRAFYCEICDKQYNKVAEYEQHLQSYDHHHKKRFKDMKEQSRKSGFAQSAKDKQREREKKREERELRRMQEAMLKKAGNAQQQQQGVPTPVPGPAAPGLPTSNTSSSSNSSKGGGGWTSAPAPSAAAIQSKSSTATSTSNSGGGGGWAMAPAAAVPATTITTTANDPTIANSNNNNNNGNKVEATTTSSSTLQEKMPTKLSFGLPQKKPSGFRFNLKKK
ncbi:hypothetical protein BDB00DRAFT_819482 [Zychaea mexicana]|uniref:uncharacterized protein n=1 Tax=Zychaea mexicana TaxID=64656 RepID=UPI0022FE48A9|nr:uncharacterized protein BDB00DRAFT_819482 [Zychaea mexicana]KAI9494271.1 hypothetical protein BDB00DRAFT_819482 [Zychaea mexicana]